MALVRDCSWQNCTMIDGDELKKIDWCISDRLSGMSWKGADMWVSSLELVYKKYPCGVYARVGTRSMRIPCRDNMHTPDRNTICPTMAGDERCRELDPQCEERLAVQRLRLNSHEHNHCLVGAWARAVHCPKVRVLCQKGHGQDQETRTSRFGCQTGFCTWRFGNNLRFFLVFVTSMATPIIIGLGAVAAALTGRHLMRKGLFVGKGAAEQWVKGGFRAKIDRKEAIAILGLKYVCVSCLLRI
jgi:hypothetical protein